MSSLSNKQLVSELRKLKGQTNSPITKAILELILSQKNATGFIKAALNQDKSPFLTSDEAQSFFLTHWEEIDQMLIDYDNTSIGKMTMEFFLELEQTLSVMAFDHHLRRVLEQIDSDFPK